MGLTCFYNAFILNMKLLALTSFFGLSYANLGATLFQTYDNGAMGSVSWPQSAGCAYSFSIDFGCALDSFLVAADMTSQVQAISSDNTTWNVYVSEKYKQHTSSVMWYIRSESCDFTDMTSSDITFSAFDGYADETTSLELQSEHSWSNHGQNGVESRTEEVSFAIDESYRAHCTPSVSLTIPCEATVVNKWQVGNEVSSQFDGSNTVIGYDLNSIWQNGFGVQYRVPADCAAHNATASLSYVAAPQLDN